MKWLPFKATDYLILTPTSENSQSQPRPEHSKNKNGESFEKYYLIIVIWIVISDIYSDGCKNINNSGIQS